MNKLTDAREIRDLLAHAEGLVLISEGMLTYKSAQILADLLISSNVLPVACDGGEHAEAARRQALGEVEQLLEARWRSAWEVWGASVDSDGEGGPSTKTRELWVAMNQRLGDLEAVREIER